MSPLRPTSILVRSWRCLRLALHLGRLGIEAGLIYPFVPPEQRTRLKQRGSHRLLTLLGVRLEATEVEAPAGCLVLANHISWLDIFAINAFRPVAFISKSEVRKWPFIGWLSARNDTIFLVRGSRGHAREINGEIDARLIQGKDVAVFPEGMTSDGTQVRNFHAALLQPAVETGRPLLPLALSYHDANGDISQAPSYVGDTSLMACFSAILSCRQLVARIQPCPIIDSEGKSRRELARLAHAAISGRLGYQEQTSSGEQGT